MRTVWADLASAARGSRNELIAPWNAPAESGFGCPPPAFLQVEPAGALGDEGVADAGMMLQPGPGGLAVVAGEVIGDDHDLAARAGVFYLLQEPLVMLAVAGGGAQGDLLPVGDAQPAVDPGLVRPAGILQRRLDPVPTG